MSDRTVLIQASLEIWCANGFVTFFIKVVAPKKARLAEAEASLAETMEILNAKRQELAEVEEKLANLKLTFAEMTEKKQQLEFQV